MRRPANLDNVHHHLGIAAFREHVLVSPAHDLRRIVGDVARASQQFRVLVDFSTMPAVNVGESPSKVRQGRQIDRIVY